MRLTRLACRLTIGVAACLGGLATATRALPQGRDPTSSPLELEAVIPLGAVRGRIDHMAIDLARRRLYIAELGNDSVAIVDLDARKVLHRISGMSEPQGVAYVPSRDALYVANARDGSVRMFRATDFAPIGRIDLGEDADNIRVDTAASRVYVGYGSGALAAIDPARLRKIADIALGAHPESFRLEPGGPRIFVNLPEAHAIAVVDRSAGREIARWRLRAAGNFPMAVDPANGRVYVVFRRPARLAAFAFDGARIAEVDTCGDADDVFVDAKRRRVYISCGDGALDVRDASDDRYRRIARIVTVPGARTSLFVPEFDRLFVAVRARGREPAAIRVLRPAK